MDELVVIDSDSIERTAHVAARADATVHSAREVDTWCHEVGRSACDAGADLLNDTWGGWDPALTEVAAEFDVGLVCSHAGGLSPRTRPFRVSNPDIMADVLARTLALAGRAVRAGVDPARIIIDPAHDFGKNCWALLGDQPVAG